MVLLAFLKLTFLLFLHLSIFFYTHPPFKTYHWIWRPWRGKKVKMIFYASMDFVWKSDYDCYYHYDYHIIAHTNNNQLVIPFNTWIPPSSHRHLLLRAYHIFLFQRKKPKLNVTKCFLLFLCTLKQQESVFFFSFRGKMHKLNASRSRTKVPSPQNHTGIIGSPSLIPSTFFGDIKTWRVIMSVYDMHSFMQLTTKETSSYYTGTQAGGNAHTRILYSCSQPRIFRRSFEFWLYFFPS